MTYQCPICSKAYTTASHLARHAIAHKPDRHSSCPFCSKTYVRKDIARRHSERCPERRGRPLARPQGRGQPRKACNRCARTKLPCDGDAPCSSCLKSTAPCSYQRLAAPTQALTPTVTQGDDRGLHTNSNMINETTTASKVPFLLSYTAAEAGHPKDFAKALATLRDSSGSALPHDGAPNSGELVDSCPMFAELFAAELFQLDVPQSYSSVSELLQVGPGPRAHEELLRQRAVELIALLEESEKCSPPHDIVTDFLTPTNLGLCLENFFNHAYRHVPIIHKATFDIASAELPLLLSICVVGAVWSYPRDTYFMALDTVDLAERCIFESTLFTELQNPKTIYHSARSTDVLPLLQAATMLVSISFAIPNAEYRRRFREQRFPEMVSVTRSLRLGSEKSSALLTSTSFEWADYIFRETCSRVVYYIYLLDCHISILYSVLPRMPVLEMQAPLPSNESAFGSENAEACREILFGDHAIPQPSLVDVVKSLVAVEHRSRDLSKLTAFPLFLAIGALQAMIFTAKTQLLEDNQSTRLERALTCWKEVWDLSRNARNSPTEVGFMVHAEEVWLLACKILKSDASRLVRRFGVNDMAQVRRWLHELD